MAKDLHMKMDDRLAETIQAWADTHHVTFSAAIHVLLTCAVNGAASQPVQENQR